MLMTTSLRRLLITTVLGTTLLGTALAVSAGAQAAPETFRIEREGIAIDVSLEPVTSADAEAGSVLREGDDVRVTVEVSDVHTGAPVSTLEPAAWMDRLPPVPETDPDACKTKVQGFLSGSLLSVPDLDLNVFYVLALNEDASISVVDPLFGFGGSKLLTLVVLDSPGEDWALTRDGATLFVSMPLSNKVAVVDTATWKVRANVEVGPAPARLELAEDGRRLWIAWDGDGRSISGVSAIDTSTLAEVVRLETGRGAHDLAFADDGRRLFVSNADDGTVTVVDTVTRKLLTTAKVGGRPLSLSATALAGAVWVADVDGALVGLDANDGTVRARLEVDPGVGQIRFAPGGRYGFAPNPTNNLLHILDAARGRVIQTGEMEEAPDRVAFSDRIGYVRHRGSDLLLMIPLDRIGEEGAPIPVIDVPGGRHPAGAAEMPASADTIVGAPGGTAVLVANPEDRAIYYYKEGMAAPMGHFQNYGRKPRATLVVDRSLRENRPGVYETVVKMRKPGLYDLALFVDSPRVVDCFEVEVGKAIGAESEAQSVRVRLSADAEHVQPGETVTLSVEVRDADGTPRTGLKDIDVLTFLSPGVWQRRQWARELGGGRYTVEVVPPREGVYYVFVEIPSEKLRANASPSLLLDARGATLSAVIAK